MSYTHITPNQRIELSALIRAGVNQKDIAEMTGKNPSSISREIQRNENEDGSGYYARNAKKKTKERRIAANQRFRKIENDELLEKYIVQKLGLYWSPEQIAGRLENVSEDMKICHETIYQYIYNVKPELKEFLRSKKGKYRSSTNENTNGLLRQYFPKKSFFANITQKDIDKATLLINNRPRKRLDYLTPHEVFNENCTLG